jgi:hypothetical protein
MQTGAIFLFKEQSTHGQGERFEQNKLDDIYFKKKIIKNNPIFEKHNDYWQQI